MKNSNMKAINGIGKACSIISNIAFIFCIVGFVSLIIVEIGILAFPMDKIKLSGNADAVVTIEAEDMDFGIKTANYHFSENNQNGFRVDVDQEGITISDDKIDFGGIWSLDVDEVETSDNGATFKLTGDFGEFDKGAIKRKLSLKMLEAFISVVATAVTLFFARRVFKELSKCETPFTDDIVKKMKVFGWVMIGYGVLTSLNLTTIVAGLAVLMLGYVFAHGKDLQQESDETL
ncbi:MAG: DUF2975 domain-containing protein [Ruminococcus sp.]|nr:DUF2975 domain-containing protein [Ruminococcus sp.]MBR3668337.1 DUF2975 domain-containing protein [Ruminococcus sp.]